MSTNFGANKFNLANETKHTQSKISHINVFAQQNENERKKQSKTNPISAYGTHAQQRRRQGEREGGRELAKAMPCFTYLIYNANSNSRKKAARLRARRALIICPLSEEERGRRSGSRGRGAAHKSSIRREQGGAKNAAAIAAKMRETTTTTTTTGARQAEQKASPKQRNKKQRTAGGEGEGKQK